MTHTYGANNGNLLSSAYGNGFTVEYVYDSLDRVTKAKYNGTIQYEYVYNAMGQRPEQLPIVFPQDLGQGPEWRL